jgi:hypothetical protein
MRIIARSGRAGLALRERNGMRDRWSEAGHRIRRKISDFGSGGNGEMGKNQSGSSFVFIMAVSGGRDDERSVSVVSPLRGLLALRGEN